jgi:putative transcriptional regulator
MVRIKLSELLGKHKMTQRALAQETGIRPATISKMYYEETKRIEIDQIDRICKAFGCSIEDLLEYIPEE